MATPSALIGDADGMSPSRPSSAYDFVVTLQGVVTPTCAVMLPFIPLLPVCDAVALFIGYAKEHMTP